MLRRNRVRLVFSISALLISLIVLLLAGGTAAAAGRCEAVYGDYYRSEGSLSWTLTGDLSGTREVVRFTGYHTIGRIIEVYKLESVVRTEDGDLYARETVYLDTATGRSIDRVRVTGGTGYWEGAKGWVIVPNDDSNTGIYFGWVCSRHTGD